MRINLVSKTVDNAKPSYTTFTVEVLEGGRTASALVRNLRRIMPDDLLVDVQMCGKHVVFTVVDVEQTKALLQNELPDLARLTT